MVPALRLRASAIAHAVAAASVITSLLAGCGSATPKRTVRVAAKDWTVEIHDYSYKPASITTRTGARITFVNGDLTAHSATASGGEFDSGTLAPHQRKTLSLSKPGKYAYYCQFHPFMRASITVLPGS